MLVWAYCLNNTAMSAVRYDSGKRQVVYFETAEINNDIVLFYFRFSFECSAAPIYKKRMHNIEDCWIKKHNIK